MKVNNWMDGKYCNSALAVVTLVIVVSSNSSSVSSSNCSNSSITSVIERMVQCQSGYVEVVT